LLIAASLTPTIKGEAETKTRTPPKRADAFCLFNIHRTGS
jgi:hypothetical protein